MSDLRELLRAAAPRPPELDLDDLARRARDEGRSTMRPFVVGIAAVGVIALIVVVIAIARADDGSSSSATGRVTAGMLARGAAETNAGTARMRGTIARDAGSGQVRTFQVQGSRDGAHDASEIHSTDPGLLGTTETRTIGDSAYQRLPGMNQWVRLDRDPAAGTQPDLTNPFSYLDQLRDIARIEPLGTGEIDGIAVTHYRVTIDMEALMKRVPPKYREEPSSTSRVFDVWVDERSRVRRFKGTETTPQVTWRYDLEFYDFGADIHMQAPSGSEVVGGGAAAVPTSEFPETSPGASADPATWTVAPGARITGAARTLNVLVRRFACNDGVTGRVAAPAIRYGANEIEVTFTVDTRIGFHTCQGNDEVPYLVHLQEPIGSRTLVDGTCRNVPDAIGSSYCASGPTRWPDPGR